MRPAASTAVASKISSDAPEFASMPRCIMCQSVALPFSALYWHMGETTIRLAKVRPARSMGENRLLGMAFKSRYRDDGDGVLFGGGAAVTVGNVETVAPEAPCVYH